MTHDAPVDNLKGQLLLSGGDLYDPNFRHTVVLIGEHDGSGAVGIILNRPMELTVEETVSALAELTPPGDPIYEGGPVATDQVVLLAQIPVPGLVDMPIFGSVGFLTGEVSQEIRPAIQRARVFVGHAGWGPGQLEAEMEAGAWITEEATEDDVFTSTPLTLWPRILKRKGPPYDTMARIPFDPSMN